MRKDGHDDANSRFFAILLKRLIIILQYYTSARNLLRAHHLMYNTARPCRIVNKQTKELPPCERRHLQYI
jgi:hypothetical protein